MAYNVSRTWVALTRNTSAISCDETDYDCFARGWVWADGNMSISRFRWEKDEPNSWASHGVLMLPNSFERLMYPGFVYLGFRAHSKQPFVCQKGRTAYRTKLGLC
jgi:hypothetical protein